MEEDEANEEEMDEFTEEEEDEVNEEEEDEVEDVQDECGYNSEETETENLEIEIISDYFYI